MVAEAHLMAAASTTSSTRSLASREGWKLICCSTSLPEVTQGRAAPSAAGQAMPSTPSHWVTSRASKEYMNQERYCSQASQAGTEPELRKKPPKSMKGMMMTGPMASATSTLGEEQEMR